MKKTLLTVTLGSLLLPALAFAAPPAVPVQAPVQAPKAVQAPTQAPVQAPVKTAQADTGYRTYSYQPAMGGTYNSYSRARYGQPRNNVFRSAADKALGRIY
jgi:hypothetical protein